MRILLNNFNAGLLDETMVGRVDLPNLSRGALRLQSFLPRIVGGVERRPGFVYCGAAKYHDRASRLLAFNFSRSQRFQLEMADGVLRVWKDGVLQPAEYVAPWTAANAHEWHFVQINDVAFLTHKDGPITVITRRGDNDWLVEDFEARLIAEPNGWPPMRDENIDPTTLVASATTGTITLTASASTFTAADVGAFYEVNHRRPTTFVDVALTASASSAEITVLGKWQLFTFGTWWGTVTLQAKTADGGWETVRSWRSNDADRNVAETGETFVETTFRLTFASGGAAGPDAPRAELNMFDSLSRGLVRVTDYTSPTVVAATVIRPLYATTATSRWAEGEWSAKRGYPRTVTLFEQRLVFAGADSAPQRIVASAESDLFNFRRDATEAAAWAYLIAAQESSPIRWLGPSSAGLIVGTEKEEWLLSSDAAINPVTTPLIRRYTGNGSSGVQPILAGMALIFIQDGARAVLEYAWSEADRSFIAPDLSELVEGYLQAGVRQVAWQRNPYSAVWFVLADGRLLSLTYRREKEIVAWAEHPTAGEVESVAVTNGDDGIDEVWIAVKRTVGGLTRRYVERLDSASHRGLLASDRMRMVYVDSGKRVTLAAAATEFPGFEHLEGELVSVVADGATRPPVRVAAGRIVLDEPAVSVLAGLPYRSALRPMPFDVQMDDGTGQGRKFKAEEISLSVWRSAAAKYQDLSNSREYPVELRDATEAPADPVTLKTRVCRLYLGGSFADSVAVEISTDQPEPLNILWLSLAFTVHGN